MPCHFQPSPVPPAGACMEGAVTLATQTAGCAGAVSAEDLTLWDPTPQFALLWRWKEEAPQPPSALGVDEAWML